MLDTTRQRKEKQPLNLPSAGSVFKRPKGRFAGALVENCGLKGFSVGGAQVSPLHAGFIVNTGKATERDVLALIAAVQQRVFEETGVHLEREIKLMSEL
jgi:UDP-N-acetylmuramate dehydrogenase